MLDLVVKDGKAAGIVVRDLITGEISRHSAHAVVLGTGGYGNAFFLSTNAKGCNATAIWRAHRKGAYFANPCYTQIHPTCIPVSGEHQSKLTLMSESLRNDGRIWVPKDKNDARPANVIPEDERDYYLERIYPAFANLVPRDVASRAAKRMVDAGHGVGPLKNGVYLDFKSAIERLGRETIEQRYGNLFEMYANITGEDPYKVPMRIYPAVHYAMGGLWVDYNLMSNLPGLFVIGEANFSRPRREPARRERAHAGPCPTATSSSPPRCRTTSPGMLGTPAPDANSAEFKEVEADVQDRVSRLLSINGKQTVDSFHRRLGKVLWDYCGMGRNAEGLRTAQKEIAAIREEFWSDVKVLGSGAELNQSLEKAGRVADFFELGELLAQDALHREESCGGHFREEHQTPDGEALRDDENFAYVAAWEFNGTGKPGVLHKEELEFEYVHPTQRSYK